MIVIADTSVLLNLCCVQQQELLRALFREVTVPPEVRLEFERAARVYPRFAGLTLPAWIREQPPRTIPEAVRRAPRLDAGEIAAIALALEIAADAVLIDETDGRRAARQLGLITIGVAGILVRGRVAGLLPAIAPVLEQLEQKANFWLARKFAPKRFAPSARPIDPCPTIPPSEVQRSAPSAASRISVARIF